MEAALAAEASIDRSLWRATCDQPRIILGGAGDHGNLGIAVALALLGQGGVIHRVPGYGSGGALRPAEPSANRPLSLAACSQLRETLGEPLITTTNHAA